jgi:[ribosomal protein S5]-alanine N-acetyltransferase
MIETERLFLREFRDSDLADIQEYASDPEVVRYLTWGPNTLEQTQQFLSNVQATRPEHGFAIELKQEKRVVGACRLTVKDQLNRSGDIGYVLNRRYWGRGYIPEAAGALLEFGFGELKMHRIWARCDTLNLASARVMEKIGMRREAHLLQDVFEKGIWRDSYIYAILESER